MSTAIDDAALQADALVIGAGVIGSAVALELTRKGYQTMVVDRLPAAGYGSTSSSSAIIRFHYSTESGVALAWESLQWWKDWPAHVGSNHGDSGLAEYVKMPILMTIGPDEPRALYLDHFDKLGIPYELLTVADLEKRWTGIDWGYFGQPCALDDQESCFWDETQTLLWGALVSDDAGFISDPALAASNLANAASAEGARFLFRKEVMSINRDQDHANKVSGVTLTDGTKIKAPIVVNVAGPHSEQINALAGVGGDMVRSGRPLRREVYIAPADRANFDSNGFLLGDLTVGVYFRPEKGNNIIVGSTEPACDTLHWVQDPDSLDDVLTEDDFQLQMLRVARRMPNFGIPHSKQGLVSMYDATPDWTPIYDRSSLNGFYMACGTSGNQFKNAPVAGWMMAELIAAVEAGHDHDAKPLQLKGPKTGLVIDLHTFSRLRPVDTTAGTTVMG